LQAKRGLLLKVSEPIAGVFQPRKGNAGLESPAYSRGGVAECLRQRFATPFFSGSNPDTASIYFTGIGETEIETGIRGRCVPIEDYLFCGQNGQFKAKIRPFINTILKYINYLSWSDLIEALQKVQSN
jgi:hypothetical protein